MGRRHALQDTGRSFSSYGFLVSAMATSAWMLIAGRFIQGAGIAANGALFRTILRDRFSGRRLAQIGSYVGLFFALIPSVAPIIGGIISPLFLAGKFYIPLFFDCANIALYHVCFSGDEHSAEIPMRFSDTIF